MIESIFKNVLIMSVVGSFLATLLIITKPITKKLFGFKWQYYIWYAVLGVMLLPLSVTFASYPHSVHSNIPVSFETAIYERLPIAVQNVNEADIQAGNRNVNETGKALFKAAAYIWFLYGSGKILLKLIQYFIYLQLVRRKSLKIKKTGSVQIWYTSLICAPLTMGLFRKKILIPQGTDNEKHLEHIMIHENTHIKHGDIYFKWLIMLVKCVHWFNPIVYTLSKETQQLCEIVCDIDSTKDMDASQQKSYMNTILSLVSSGLKNTSELTTHMANDKSNIAERFTAIVSLENQQRSLKCVSVIFAVLLTVMSLGMSALAGGMFCKDSPLGIRVDLIKNTQSKSVASDSGNEEDVSVNDISGDGDNGVVFGETTDESYSGKAVTEHFSKSVSQNPADLNPEYYESVSDNTSNSDVIINSGELQDGVAPVESEADAVYEKYPYSGQIRYDGLTFEKITSDIDLSGGVELHSDNSGVADGYIPGKLTYKNDGVANHKNIKCDENGQITFYMASEYDQHINIVFNQDGKQIAGYGIIPDGETTYVFGGFNPGDEYDIEISTYTGSTWMIESDYLLY